MFSSRFSARPRRPRTQQLPTPALESLERRVLLSAVWTPLGPFAATNGQVENISPNNEVSGAIHTVLAHPTNPDILYVGAVNGGVWKTTNATAASPTWTPLTDSQPSQSIGAMTFDVADASHQTVYAGTGRSSSFAQRGNDRIGLLRTTDGGATWQVVNGGGTLTNRNISGVYANGNTLVVSVNTSNPGVYRSTDGGATFALVSIGNGSTTGLPAGISNDLVFDSVTPTTLYVPLAHPSGGGAPGIYKSTDAGASWTKVSSAAIEAQFTGSTSNVELAVGQSNNVYVGVINSGRLAGIFRSGDGGINWVQMDTPVTNEGGTDVGVNPSGGKGPTDPRRARPEAFAGGQGSIHFSIVADPNNAQIVYVGGDRQPLEFQFPSSVGAFDYSGRLFRGDASQAPGSQWAHLTHSNTLGAPGGGTASSSSPHADSREMTFDANGNLIEVDDGGIYRRTSPQSNTGDWFSIIGNLQVTEAHDVAWDAVSNVAMTGNQDTGTTQQPTAGAARWQSVSTADGGDVAVDDVTLAGSGQSLRYSSFQNLGSFRRRTYNAAGTLLSTAVPALTGPSISKTFRTPVELNALDPRRLIIQGSNGVFESLNQGNNVANASATGVAGQTTSEQNAIAYGGRRLGADNLDVLWVGSGSNVYFRSGPGNVTQVPTDPTNQTIRDLVIDPDDWMTAFIIDPNQVFMTADGGSTWTDITGNLLTKATDVWSITYVATATIDAVIVGTNRGIFASAAGALGTWARLGGNLPNVLVFDMEYDAADNALVAGTLGRGAWSLTGVTQAVVELFSPPTITGSSVNPTTVNRSGIAQLTFDFNLPVTITSPMSLQLFNHTTGTPVSLMGATLSNNGSSSVTWNLTGVSLPDGRYSAELAGSQATSEAGFTLAAPGTATLHKLTGDVDGSGAVNFADFGVVGTHFDPAAGAPFRAGDANGDGMVNVADFGVVGASFNPLGLPPLEFDFGDAPESGTSFATTLAQNGARHITTGNSLLLGAGRDTEVDGQPNATATGDGSDEDGIAFGALNPGSLASVTVTASGTGFLNAWIDLNADGDWNDAGEQIFLNQALSSGPNNLQFLVPPGTAPGTTLTRFRLTSTAGYGFAGVASQGEVEDYVVTVSNPPPAAAGLLAESTTVHESDERPEAAAPLSLIALPVASPPPRIAALSEKRNSLDPTIRSTFVSRRS
jgi:hypothetical protein